MRKASVASTSKKEILEELFDDLFGSEVEPLTEQQMDSLGEMLMKSTTTPATEMLLNSVTTSLMNNEQEETNFMSEYFTTL